MKTLELDSKTIRVTDQKAEELVNKSNAKYVPKSRYKALRK